MDSTLIAAGIGGLATVGAAAGGNVWRIRVGARTAARLVYAELTTNAAPLRYYRATKRWSEWKIGDSTWREHGKELARVREPECFEQILRGYSALELLSTRGAAPDEDEEYGRLFERAVADAKAAMAVAGRVGRISEAELAAHLSRLDPHHVEPGSSTAPLDEAFVALDLLERVRERGTESQRREVERTLEASGGSDGAAPAQQRAVGEPNRLVLDAHNKTDLSEATPVRAEGEPATGDAAVDEAYDAAGATFRFYGEVYGRDLLDGEPGPLPIVVHYGDQFLNTWWNGSEMVVGDGGDSLFRSFTSSVDVIAHELTHKLLEPWLAFEGQTAALIESLADVFGIMVKQYELGQTVTEADWLVGAGIWQPAVKGRALRTLAAPGNAYDDPVLGKDPQVAEMEDFVNGDAMGLRHVNSGIPNHAFYVTAMTLGGHAWDRAGEIWYDAVWNSTFAGPIPRNCTFSQFASRTISSAEGVYGKRSDEVAAVRDGWKTVGVRPRAPSRAVAA